MADLCKIHLLGGERLKQKKQLCWNEATHTWVPEGERIFGKVDWDEIHGIIVVVDGVKMTMEDFQRTLAVREGWYFELRFFDATDVEAPTPQGTM